MKWFVRGDLDGFFGLFIDNLLQLMLIVVLCRHACNFPDSLIFGTILPGAAISILVGNVFYTLQARRLAQKTGRDNVTALPYGINTPSLITYVLLIMAPISHQTKDPQLAWRVGLVACLFSGIIESAGAFVGDWIRRNTPRAALLSALAGIAIAFISMGFTFQIFASPAIAIIPMMLILISYASRIRLPLGLPGGLMAIILGTGIAWGMRLLGTAKYESINFAMAFHLPVPVLQDLFALITSPYVWQYLSVIVPMGLFNVIGSLQNLESAEAGGDRYETKPSLLVNGLGSIVAAVFGSAFPTTIYIGHPAWKAMGARSGYSLLNGIFISIVCLFGWMLFISAVIPLEVAIGILLWIGLVITAQAFQEVPKAHALAVALGLVPALASWALYLIETTLRVTGSSLCATIQKFGADLYIHGVIALSQGFLLSSMLLCAMLVFVIERRFFNAFIWACALAVLSFFGLIHAYDVTELGVQNKFGLGVAPGFAATYALTAIILLWLHLSRSHHS